MSGQNAGQARSRANQKWSDRIDMDGLVQFLRQRFPEKTAANVSAATGDPIDTVKKWLSREANPGGIALIGLVLAFGPEPIFAAVKVSPEWLSAAVRAERRRAVQAELDDVRARLKALDL